MKTYTAQEISSRANKALLNEIVLLIAHSFSEDPYHNWLFPNHTRELFISKLPKFIRVIVQLSIASDASFTIITSDEVGSTANKHVVDQTSTHEAQVSLPPDATICAVSVNIPPHGHATYDSFFAGLCAGAWILPFNCGIRFAWRLIVEFLPQLEKMHNDVFPDPATKHRNWHLFYLATHPASRGQGLGTRLLQDAQATVQRFNEEERAKAKAEGDEKKFEPYPLYLEASTVDSKRLYNRSGFEDRAEMANGELNDGENLRIAENGRVMGLRQFGMTWSPSLPS